METASAAASAAAEARGEGGARSANELKLEEATRLYRLSKIREAYQIVESMTPSSSKPEGKEHAMAAEIKAKYAELVRTRALLDDASGWETVVDNYNGVSTFHRSEEDTPIHSLKVIGIIEAPVQHLLSLVIEADLIPTFINFIKIEVEQLRVMSVYHQLIYQKVPLPWPLSTRDIVVEAQGFDELEHHGDLVITGKSVSKYEDVKIPKVANGSTRLEVHLAGGRIRPITMNKVEVTVVANVDFQMYLPNAVINWLSKTLAYYAFVQFRAKAASTSGNGAHYERVKEKKEVYAQVMEPVIHFLAKKEKESQAAEKKSSTNEDSSVTKTSEANTNKGGGEPNNESKSPAVAQAESLEGVIENKQALHMSTT